MCKKRMEAPDGGVPSVTAILLVYNCEAFVTPALRSALTQDYGPIEIIVSDDASEDGTYEIVRREIERYRGPHHVRLERRQSNSGSKSAHLNDVLPLATGEIIVSFDGDDISEPQRVRRLVDAFGAAPDIMAVYSDFLVIDGFGRTLGPGRVPRPPSTTDSRQWFARVDAFAAGATLAFRREVVANFPPLDPEVHEDVTLPFRASLIGEVRFVDCELVRFRRHAASLTRSPTRFDSLDAYRSRMLWGIEKARKNSRSRLEDVETMAGRDVLRSRELQSVRELVLASMAAAELTAGMVDPSLRVRLGTLLKLVRTGAYPEERARNLCLALFPGAYLWYKRHKLRRTLKPMADRRADRAKIRE